MGGLALFLAHTRWGFAIRAVAQDLDAARSMAVPVNRLYPLTMGLASALAGVAGVFLGRLRSRPRRRPATCRSCRR